MVGKLKIDMLYKPELGTEEQLWGDFTLTYCEDNNYEELHHTNTQLDKFIKWYVMSSPHIFSDLSIPLLDNKGYAEGIDKYLDELEGEFTSQIYNRLTMFNNINNAFGHPGEPDIYLVRRGEFGEISSFQGRKTHLQPIPRFKIGTWVYLFDLQDFVYQVRNTIFDFLDEVQVIEAGKDSKYIEVIVAMASTLNVLPKID
ncbi:MAG: hypothetical protein Phog2KO_33330 [Phototrophicaceae bacterium]